MEAGESFLSEPRASRDPVTGRKLIQLTSGDGFDYPMYYYIPTVTRDNRIIVFHRYDGRQVQLYKIEVATGLTTRLTNAQTPNCLWRPWRYDTPATGVRDLMSAFNEATGDLLYFDSQALRAVNIHTLADRMLYRLPEDRVPCSLTGISTDGEWFCFAHADASQWAGHAARGPARTDLTGVRLDALRIATGETKTLVETDHWITHANFYDHERVLFCHAATEHAILLTDLAGGYYKHVRTMRGGMQTCHYQATEKGILYEVITKTKAGGIGLCDPDNHRCREYRTARPVYHVGYDPAGKLWFHSARNTLAYFPSLAAGAVNEAVALTGAIETYSSGQRSHLHPALTRDRQHILFTGGDARTRTNHLFLLDIADLSGTETVLR